LEFVDETEVLMGLELDYNEKMVAYYKDLLPRLPLDFVVGSIHSVSDWVIDLPDSFAQSSLRGLDANGIYQAYFLELQNAAKSGLFHFLAHPDFVKKALPLLKMSKPKDLSPLFRETADILSACEVGIEINTYGKYCPRWENITRMRNSCSLVSKRKFP
jgi:histidinol-phosphatase (PHP family)